MAERKLFFGGNHYLFPEGASAVDCGGSLSVYINGQLQTGLEPYLAGRDFSSRKGALSYLLPMLSSHSFLAVQYSHIEAFLQKNKSMSYLQFDNAACEDMILFSFLPVLSLAEIDALLTSVNKTMPFILNIFLRPVIHLKSENFIIPVDAVKKIDQKTVQHILSHSEHWNSFENDGKIKPARLLTTVYEDDYSIYENRVFCRMMDRIVFMLKRYKNIFTDIIYNKICFDLSVVDKSNHLYHYLALGKLYVGYVKSDELFAERCTGYIGQFDKLIERISSQKVREVYKKNGRFKVTERLRKTNIFAMHKDYRHIYRLGLMLDKTESVSAANISLTLYRDFTANYQNFCFMLSVFAVAHFRFKAENAPVFEGDRFKAVRFNFAKWRADLYPVTITCLNIKAAALTTVTDNLKHTTLLIPFAYGVNLSDSDFFDELLEDIYTECPADNYIFFVPERIKQPPSYYSNSKISYGILPLSVNDINSFKRIQKLLLISMVRTSRVYDICPFCGGDFLQSGEKYFCKKCKTELYNTECPRCSKPFVYTHVGYPSLKEKVVAPYNYSTENYWKYCSDKDAHLNYRNITDLTSTGQPVCPNCNKGPKKPAS